MLGDLAGRSLPKHHAQSRALDRAYGQRSYRGGRDLWIDRLSLVERDPDQEPSSSDASLCAFDRITKAQRSGIACTHVPMVAPSLGGAHLFVDDVGEGCTRSTMIAHGLAQIHRATVS